MHRIQNGVVSVVPASGVAPDGRSISGLLPEYISSMDISQRQTMGFYRWLVEDENVKVPTADPAADCIRVPVPVPAPPVPLWQQKVLLSKPHIRELVRSRGVEAGFFAMLAQADLTWLWDDSSCFESDDPRLAAMVPGVAQLVGESAEWVWNYLGTECRY